MKYDINITGTVEIKEYTQQELPLARPEVSKPPTRVQAPVSSKTQTYRRLAKDPSLSRARKELKWEVLFLAAQEVYDTQLMRSLVLQTGISPKQDRSKLLAVAVLAENHPAVAALIPVSNPKAEGSRALRYAAKYNQLESVAMLIPVSDPNARRCFALRHALLEGADPHIKAALIMELDNTTLDILAHRLKYRMQCMG